MVFVPPPLCPWPQFEMEASGECPKVGNRGKEGRETDVGIRGQVWGFSPIAASTNRDHACLRPSQLLIFLYPIRATQPWDELRSLIPLICKKSQVQCVYACAWCACKYIHMGERACKCTCAQTCGQKWKQYTAGRSQR